ncbi:MAG TPA: MarR family winged helix-turn-helix transcriptional regulator [Chloroflexota bacterium]|jgi:DNA-binding MarR family transcriptional regulator|nr:MarR family winged helix-turn-helix transcriptional regulator [Chloroflexota bacterium]
MLSAPPRAARAAHVEALADELPARASLVSRLIRRYIARYADVGINASNTGVLSALKVQPRRITELAELEGQTQPYVTKIVSDLEARGWVERRRDTHDGRVVWVHLTDAGRDSVVEAVSSARAMFVDCLSTLTDDELERLADASTAMAPLVEALQQAVAR